jgi:O-antigen/teichoic acid export membrane protein
VGFKEKFFKNVAVFGGYTYLSWIFDSLISTIILSRFLGPAEYGFVALIYVFSGFIVLFSNTGLNYAIIRSGYGLTYQKLIFNISIWIGVILTLALCLLAYPITLIYGNPDLFWPTIVISLQFIVNAFTIVPKAILEKRFEFQYVGRMNFYVTVITISMMILMAVLGFSYWALIIPMVIQPLIRYIFFERKVKLGIHLYGWKLTRLGFSKIRSLMLNISAFNLFNYFARNADSFAVGKFFGEASLGLYDRAYKFLYMSRRLINTVMGPVLFPSLTEEREKGNDYRPQFLDIIGMVNFMNLAIAFPLIMFARPISLILWGEDWVGVADYMPYVGAIIPIQILAIAAQELYVIEKNEKAYVTLGIPMSLILVGGIVVGAFFSPLHIIRFYALALFLVQTPVNLYFGHYRILKFSPRQLLRFWGPKTLLSAALVFSIWFGTPLTTGGLYALFLLETLLTHGRDAIKVFKLVKTKLLKRGN